jgi:hypothetical protein
MPYTQAEFVDNLSLTKITEQVKKPEIKSLQESKIIKEDILPTGSRSLGLIAWQFPAFPSKTSQRGWGVKKQGGFMSRHKRINREKEIDRKRKRRKESLKLRQKEAKNTQ